MDAANNSAESLRQQIKETEEQLKNLKIQLQELESREAAAETQSHDSPPASSKWPLSPEEYKRYGRQMIVPNIGIQGQLRLKSASVLIIGVGGLGCPAAAYLAGAGVGTLGLVDGDVVETSNLHRQILHSTARIGMKKVDSAIEYLKTLNPTIKYIPHTSHLTPQTASSIVQNYDLVLDCTDHPTSRYLISDICILHCKPLISASALRTDGQLLLLNHPALPPGTPGGGPCYRCVFPKPPPAESVVSCGDGGILGPVVGVMGVLQALEALKLITSGNLHSTESQAGATMLLFSSSSTPPFRQVRLRSTRRPNCFACSGSPSPTNPSTSILTLDSLNNGTLNYAQFCGLTSPVTLLTPSERITASQYHTDLSKKPHILVDVREKIQFDICSLPGSVNVPFSSLGSLTFQGKEGESVGLDWLGGGNEEVDGVGGDDGRPIYVVCRLGNDSQIAVRKFRELGIGRGKGAENGDGDGDGDGNGGRYIGDLKDGLKAWKRDVDESWPEY